ncbi:MAG TPA: tetratricopeptide repeat protein [Methylomirabilota bacterium]|nr:tetratricopeptide repeat protein [Methylomirabilota bacterium]
MDSPLIPLCPRSRFLIARCACRMTILGLFVLMLAACAQSPEAQKQKALERGETYLRKGQYNEAIIEFRNALQVDPEFVPALHALGRAYEGRSWFFDAWRELTRAQKLAPDSVPIAVDLGKVLLEFGAWDEADAQVELILGREPRNSQALTIRAGSLLGRGKAQEAVALLQAVSPGSNPEVDRIRADILLSGGNFDGAEAAYRAVLAVQPDELKTLLGLATISRQRKKLDEAKEFYKQAKATHPYDPRPSVGLASTMAEQGNLAEAIKELEEVHPHAWTLASSLALGQYYLQANRPVDAVNLLGPVVRRLPQNAQARYLYGTALALAGDAMAAEQFEELDRQLANDPLVRLRLASLYTDQGRPREALGKLDPIARQADRSPVYHLERARALVLLGRFDEAVAAAETARRLAPRMPETYVLLGQIRAQRGNFKGAEEMFTKAAEVDPSFVPAYLAAGHLHVLAKDVTSALKDFDAAVKADPNSLRATSTKAATLVEQNRGKDAIAFVEEAVRSGRGDPGFYALLGNLYSADGQKGKAVASFKRVLETDPRSVPARLGLARIAMAEGNDEEAVVQLQAAVKERPGDLTSVLLLRSLYDRLGRPELAIPVLEASIKAEPRQLAFALALAEVYGSVGRYDDALARTAELLARHPDLSAARLVRGQAYLAKGDPGSALGEFQEAVRSSPKSAPIHGYLARVYAAVGRKEDAQAEYREAIRLDSSFARAKRELAALRGEKPDERSRREEIEPLREAIKNDPKNVVGRELLARTYFEQGQLPEAERELKLLLELAPRLAEPNYLMARILLGQGKEEEAVKYLRVALRGNPSHVGSNVLLGRYLASKGQREQARQPLEAALSVNPSLTEAKFLLANLYAQSGRFQDALALAQSLARADSKAAAPLVLVGAMEVAQQNPRAAVDAFDKAVRLNPQSVEAHRGLGQAYGLLGQNDRSEESYRRALKLDGNDVVSLNDLAWLLAEIRNKPEEALPLAEKAEQLAPQLGWVTDTLGWIYYRRGAYAEAEKILLRAAEHAPANGLVQFHLGLTYEKLGRKTDAASALRQAAKLDPQLAEREKVEQRIKGLEG